MGEAETPILLRFKALVVGDDPATNIPLVAMEVDQPTAAWFGKRLYHWENLLRPSVVANEAEGRALATLEAVAPDLLKFARDVSENYGQDREFSMAELVEMARELVAKATA